MHKTRYREKYLLYVSHHPLPNVLKSDVALAALLASFPGSYPAAGEGPGKLSGPSPALGQR